MNKISLEKYLEFQITMASGIISNMPTFSAELAKKTVDKILEMNNTEVAEFNSATKDFHDKKI